MQRQQEDQTQQLTQTQQAIEDSIVLTGVPKDDTAARRVQTLLRVIRVVGMAVITLVIVALVALALRAPSGSYVLIGIALVLNCLILGRLIQKKPRKAVPVETTLTLSLTPEGIEQHSEHRGWKLAWDEVVGVEARDGLVHLVPFDPIATKRRLGSDAVDQMQHGALILNASFYGLTDSDLAARILRYQKQGLR
jgi:uncharacterized membrane protein YuzA (DUF378 family)